MYHDIKKAAVGNFAFGHQKGIQPLNPLAKFFLELHEVYMAHANLYPATQNLPIFLGLTMPGLAQGCINIETIEDKFKINMIIVCH